MADKSAIEWTDATWNPVVGCSIVSSGCTNCYAMKMAARIEKMAAHPMADHVKVQTHYAGTTQPSKAGAVWTGKVALAPDHIVLAPLHWKRPRRIFVNSMGDLFHESIPDGARQQPDVLRKLWPLIDDVCGEHAIHVHIVDGLINLELKLLDGQSLQQSRWHDRLVQIGMQDLLDYAHKAQALYGKGRGGGKQFARGMLECINKGLRNKLRANLGEDNTE